MATIGSLVINLAARTGQFTKGLASGAKSTSRFVTTLERGTSKLLGFGGALTSIAGAAGLGFLVKGSFASVDALAKTATKLGDTTENLSRFHHAAELTGVGVNTANMALQRMVRRVAEAAEGTGEAKGALEELGVDAKKLAELAPTEAFKELADAFSRVEGQGNKVRLGFKLFDSEGVALVNTLAAGREGLEAMGREADETGRTVGSKMAKDVQAANDSMTAFWGTVRGLANQIAGVLAPAVEKMATIGAKWVTTIFKAGVALGTIIVVLRSYVAILRTAAKAQAIVNALSGPAGWARVVVGAGLAVGALVAVDAAFDGIVDSGRAATAQTSELAGALDRAAAAGENAAKKVPQLSPEAREWQGLVKTAGELNEKYMSAAAAQKRFAEQQDSLQKLLLLGKISFDQYMRALGDYRSQLGSVDAGAKLVADLEKQLRTFGLSRAELARYEAAQLGASRSDLARAEAIQHELDKLEDMATKHKELVQLGTRLGEATQTPLETFKNSIEALEAALGTGTISWEQYGRAVGNAYEQLTKAGEADGPQGVRLAGAAVRGSQEAFSAIARHRVGATGNQDVGRNTKLTVDELKEANAELKDVNRNLKQQGIETVDILS